MPLLSEAETQNIMHDLNIRFKQRLGRKTAAFRFKILLGK